MFASSVADQILQVNNSLKTADIKEENSKALLDLLKGLSNGETILGKVISSSDSSYVFKTLDSGVTVNAKAGNGVFLENGSTVLFEVNKLSDNRVNLRPLNMNTSTSETAQTAIKSAGLPLNERTLEMTVRNMEYGNPIDKHSLYESYKDVMKYPDTPVKYIVDLQTMEIPVSKDNLFQYEAYNNMKNSMSEDLFNLSESLANSFKVDRSVLTDETVLLPTISENIDNTITILNSFAVNLEDKEIFGELSADLKKVVEELSLQKNSVLEPEKKAPEEKEPVSFKFINNGNDNLQKADTNFQKNPVAMLKEAAVKFNSDIEEVFVKNLVDRISFNETKTPQKEEIAKLYEKLFSDSKKLTGALEEVIKAEPSVTTQIHNINSNIDFMNSLNHFVPYVQIPFKTDSQGKTGELYVFRNRGGKTAEDGELSAFLHLDTQNLGPADIFIKKRNDNIKTHFTLKDEESLDFIEKNIHYLDDRLQKKGYNFSFESSLKEDFKPPIQEAMDRMLSKVVFANTSFDARV